MIGDIIAVLGAVLILISAIGVVRFADPLARMHALAKASTLGVLLILLGSAINLTDVNDITSIALAGILHLFTSPPASNMVSRAIYLAQNQPTHIDVIDEGDEPLRLHRSDTDLDL
jgi:multicomponent Na+:H+ antiporter subunit G